jgi:hypothetical protein
MIEIEHEVSCIQEELDILWSRGLEYSDEYIHLDCKKQILINQLDGMIEND